MEKTREELCLLCNQAKEMLKLARQGVMSHSSEKIKEAEEIGKRIHLKSEELTARLVKEEKASLVGFPGHFERIGDGIESILVATKTKIKEGLVLSDKALAEVNLLFKGTSELLECLHDNIRIKNEVLINHIIERAKELNRLASDSGTRHEERLIAGICMPRVGPLYLDILDSLKGINCHLGEMAGHL
ncbi:hypothetical protein KKC52_13885 [bacterium]|nr:hypothetical protein [bacterium]